MNNHPTTDITPKELRTGCLVLGIAGLVSVISMSLLAPCKTANSAPQTNTTPKVELPALPAYTRLQDMTRGVHYAQAYTNNTEAGK